MHGEGGYMVKGGMCGEGGACMAKGGMHGKGGYVWQKGACLVKGGAWQRGVCMAKGGMHGEGGHAWQRGACVAKGGVHGMYAPYEIWPVNARVVRILLECILILLFYCRYNENINTC